MTSSRFRFCRSCPRAAPVSSCTARETASEEKTKIEEALDLQTELKTDVLFYRKNGTSV